MEIQSEVIGDRDARLACGAGLLWLAHQGEHPADQAQAEQLPEAVPIRLGFGDHLSEEGSRRVKVALQGQS